MITSIARQSVILKCLRKKSVLVGNYEFYYLAGLLKKLYKLPLSAKTEPMDMQNIILEALPNIQAASEEEEFLLRMVSIYEPLVTYDKQMEELFCWGALEPDLWMVNTVHSGEEFMA